jgi:CheY-like chemotaxis protein
MRWIPIIAVTSYALRGEEKKAREAGCDDYVPKPFSLRYYSALHQCPLSGVKRTLVLVLGMSAFDPERHFATVNCRVAKGKGGTSAVFAAAIGACLPCDRSCTQLSDRLDNCSGGIPSRLKCHYEQGEAIQGECYANPSS